MRPFTARRPCPVLRRIMTLPAALVLAGFCGAGCGGSDGPAPPPPPDGRLTPAVWTERYALSDGAAGMLEFYDNLYNLSVVSRDENPYRAQYNAGYVQGKLAGALIRANRDNDLQTMPMQHGDPPEAIDAYIALVEQIANENLAYTLGWIPEYEDAWVREKLTGFLYRMLGIEQGASNLDVQALSFDGEEVFETGFFPASDLLLNYEGQRVTFLDVYFLNAFSDLMDNLDAALGFKSPPGFDRCSAFIVKTGTDLVVAHTAWNYFTNTIPVRASLFVNGDYLSMQSVGAALIYSQDDFGYNGNGIVFDETTVANHREPHPLVESLWSFWQAALAESYAATIDDFFELVSINNSGTYLNGYQVADVHTGEFGLIEMDETTYYYFRPDGAGGHQVECKPGCTDRSYDQEMLTGAHVYGFNFPVSNAVRESLGYPPTPPPYESYARYYQFRENIGSVTDVESAKAMIAYFAEGQPISVSARWDLYQRHPMAGGSTVTKAVSASMIRGALGKRGALEDAFWWGRSDPMWMKFGPPVAAGGPFVWSESPWAEWRHQLLPDVMHGEWALYFSHVD